MDPFTLRRGDSPIILAFPHAGFSFPHEVAERLNDEGRLSRDTDWHIQHLYADLIPGLTTITANHSRYVIDVNRDPGGASLYPGQTTTGLIPETTFDNVPIWRAGAAPGPDDIAHWLDKVHRPYHAALTAEIGRIKSLHGTVILYDCHSIRSQIPWLFDGILPDLNIGTDNGTTCAPEIEAAVAEIARQSPHSSVLNGRFRGGWTTRHYGRPETGIHAIQMELAQISYLKTEAPIFTCDQEKAGKLRLTLAKILKKLADLAPSLPQT